MDEREPKDAASDPVDYLAAARESYATFSRLRREGAIAAGARLQLSLPVNADAQGLDCVLNLIPCDDIALEWTVAVGSEFLDGSPGGRLGGHRVDETIHRLTCLSAAVPTDVPLGYRLSARDRLRDEDGSHAASGGAGLAELVALANAIARSATRRLGWFEIAVPACDEDGELEALADLDLDPETRLHLGLADGREGTEAMRRRVETARRYVSDFALSASP